MKCSLSEFQILSYTFTDALSPPLTIADKNQLSYRELFLFRWNLGAIHTVFASLQNIYSSLQDAGLFSEAYNRCKFADVATCMQTFKQIRDIFNRTIVYRFRQF